MDTKMNGVDMVSLDETGDSAKKTWANPPAYLETVPATLLMLFKLMEGLTKGCFAIFCAVVVNTIVTSVNKTLAQESIVADIKTMVAQLLNAAKVPGDVIRQVLEMIPTQINFQVNGALAFYVFLAFLPFALLAAVEAVAAIRLRFGKGGSLTLEVLHKIYFVVDLIKMLAGILSALAMSFFTIGQMGFTSGTFFAIVFISLGIFYVLVHIPSVLYHRGIAGVMKGIGYELSTGMRAKVKASGLKVVCIILMVFTAIGAVVSIGAFMESGVKGAVFAGSLVPLFTILKYVFVMLSYQNFANAVSDTQPEDTGRRSHTPLLILVGVVSLVFVVPTVVLCVASGQISSSVSESVSDYISKTKDEVAEYVKKAEAPNPAGQAKEAETAKSAEAATAAGAEKTADAAKEADAGKASDSAKEADAGSAADAAQAAGADKAAESAQAADQEKTAESAKQTL